MTAEHAGRSPAAYELKSADLPLVALCLHSTNLDALSTALEAEFGDNPGFFDHDAVVIDLSHPSLPPQDTETLDLPGLVTLLRRYRMAPVAIKGLPAGLAAAALASGLTLAEDTQLHGSGTQTVVQEVVHEVEVIREVPVEVPTAAPPALVVDKPLRSGQRVYARGGDLIVLAMVNPGAEVIADGNIHVYAPLRGKAMAGARGNTEARIYTLSLEAELLSVAGMYRTSDVPLPDTVAGKPAQIRLEGEKLIMEPLKA